MLEFLFIFQLATVREGLLFSRGKGVAVVTVAGEVGLGGVGSSMSELLLGGLCADVVFDAWISGVEGAGLGKGGLADFVLKGREDALDVFVFLDQLLVLAAALRGSPASDEDGHLPEDLNGSKWAVNYLLCSLLFIKSLL